MDFAAMAELCAPKMDPATLRRIASVESSFNPFAIGVVGGRLVRQPTNRDEALATANMLAANGYDYSVGLVQVNQKNFVRYGVTAETAFDPCVNLRVGSLIFQDCLERAGGSVNPLGHALSCYYSGNFSTGYKLGYVARVLNVDLPLASGPVGAIPLAAGTHRKPQKGTAQPKPAPSEPLFVSRPVASIAPVAASDTSPTPKGPDTALLF